MKSYGSGLEVIRYWTAWSVKREKKRELQGSLPLTKGPHTLHSVKYKSLERRWKLITNLNLLRPNYQLEHCASPCKRKKKKKNIKFVMHLFYLGSNEFLQKKSIRRSVPLCLTRKLQVRYWKICGLLTQTCKHMISSTSYWWWLIRRKAFNRHCIPRSIWRYP